MSHTTPTSTSPVVTMFEFLSKMSTAKKEKVQVSWAMIATVALFLNLFGTLDVRRYVDVLKNLPDIQKEQTELRKDINEIKAVLIRNKLAVLVDSRTAISTVYAQ